MLRAEILWLIDYRFKRVNYMEMYEYKRSRNNTIILMV